MVVRDTDKNGNMHAVEYGFREFDVESWYGQGFLVRFICKYGEEMSHAEFEEMFEDRNYTHPGEKFYGDGDSIYRFRNIRKAIDGIWSELNGSKDVELLYGFTKMKDVFWDCLYGMGNGAVYISLDRKIMNNLAYRNCASNAEKRRLESIFPELRAVEAEDDGIRRDLIEFVRQYGDNFYGQFSKASAISWIEKQGEQKSEDKCAFSSIPRLLEMIEPTDRAKLYCQKLIDSLQQEGYAADANIVGDCLKQMNGEKVAMATMDEQNLTVTFDDIPEWRQSEEQHTNSKEDNINEETNAPSEYGKYVDECLNEASKHFFSEGEDTYSVADLFYAGVRCGESWLEKARGIGTGNQPHEGDPDNPYDMPFEDAQQYASSRGIDIPINDGDVFADERHITQTIGNILRWADEHPKGEPKFRVGDWIISDDSSINKDYDICRIINVEDGNYTVESIYGHKDHNTFEMFEKNYRLWNISYAKNGDILFYVTDKGELWIMSYYSLYEPYRGHVHYNALLANDELSGKGTCFICIDNLKPATKEQREQLEKALEDAISDN